MPFCLNMREVVKKMTPWASLVAAKVTRHSLHAAPICRRKSHSLYSVTQVILMSPSFTLFHLYVLRHTRTLKYQIDQKMSLNYQTSYRHLIRLWNIVLFAKGSLGHH